MIRIDLKSDRVTLGGRISGQATWNSDGGKQPRSIEVHWRRRFEGKRDAESIIDDASETNTEARSQIVVPFDFAVPTDEPPTYSGRLVTVIWEIVATADLPWATDEKATTVVNVTVPVWTAEQYRDSFNEQSSETDQEDD
jgi:hypothetical protein